MTIYFLKHKETGKLATLDFTSMDEHDMSVLIGSYGTVHYTTDSYLKAMKVLTSSAECIFSDNEHPEWDKESFGDDYTIISTELKDQVEYTETKFPYLPDVIDYKKCKACFMIAIPEDVVAKIEIDHTLTDDVLFPDKISSHCTGYVINYTDPKFNELVGQIVMLGQAHNSLSYIHAIVDEQIARDLKLVGRLSKDFTLFLVSRVA